MNKHPLSTYKIAATYIGTVIGAGFASGQELLQFFVVFGYKGVLGLVFVTFLFILFGYKIMEIGRKLESTSHQVIVNSVCGKTLGNVLDYVVTFFLFGTLTAMIAGTGAMLNEQFGISELWGNFLMTFLVTYTVLKGMKGIVNSISLVIPFLLVSTIFICIVSFLKTPLDPSSSTGILEASSMIKNWWWAAILYASYNLILSVAVLGPLGVEARNKKVLKRGALLGGISLGLCAFIIYLVLMRHSNALFDMEVPMLYITSKLSNTIQIIYITVVITAIYTTAIGNLFGFIARITDISNPNAKFVIVCTSLVSLFASQIGFTNLVKYFYPLIGYSGFVFLFHLLFANLRIIKDIYPIKAQNKRKAP